MERRAIWLGLFFLDSPRLPQCHFTLKLRYRNGNSTWMQLVDKLTGHAGHFSKHEWVTKLILGTEQRDHYSGLRSAQNMLEFRNKTSEDTRLPLFEFPACLLRVF